MVLTKELIEKIISSNTKCTYLNSDYVILYKQMEAEDSELESYIERLAQAQKSGINTPKIIEYQLLEEGTRRTSKGIFVEERAQGTVLRVRGKVLKVTENYDFREIIAEYLEKVNEYLNELEKRATADPKIYEKFLEDFINIHNFGLRADPNSLNYLFDSEKGFTIIDPYYSTRNCLNEKELFSYIMNAVYGVGRPLILIKKDILEGFYYLPEDLKKRLDSCSKQMNAKVALAFQKLGFSEDYILTGLEKNNRRFKTENESFNFNELVEILEEKFYNKNIKNKI